MTQEAFQTLPSSALPSPDTTFRDLPLSEEMHAALAAAGYEKPTPVQAAVIPPAMQGTDVLGQARTGTGKTASFVIPVLERLFSVHGHGPHALILVPTRELAVQVREEVVKLSHGRRISCAALYGGKPIKQQIDKLKRGAHVVVGTPGRVLDHMARGTLPMEAIKMVILDEADRMLDIGFRPDIEKILRKCPRDRQTLLLSATVPPPVEKLAQRYMRDPIKMDLSPTDIAVGTIEQFYFTVDPERKFELLVRLIAREQPQQAIIFCRTKRGTEKIFQRLSKKTQGVGAIHGDMQQSARDRMMQDFREGKVRYLVATDVVGRGIDVSSISHIINYDIPQFCDDYVHRVGRTGRMGRDGVAYSFVSSEEGAELTRIEMRIDKLLKRDEIEGFETQVPTAHRVPDAVANAREEQLDLDGKPTAAVESSAPKTPPPPPPGRAPKRYRRAL